MSTGQSLSSCPGCRDEQCVEDRPYRGLHAIFQGRNLWRCGACGLVFINPMPSQDDWDRYNQDFFVESEGGLPKDPDTLLFFKGIARLRLQYIVEHAGWVEPPDAVLEIGPGPGFLCDAYLQQRPDARFAAVETDHSCQEMLREKGVEVFDAFEQIPAESTAFDLVIISHVLEHIQDPAGLVKTAMGCLRPGGYMFIEVPCRDFEYKRYWDAHILFFDKPSMDRVLQRAGLQDFRLSYHGEDINRLKRQLSLFNKALARFKVTAVLNRLQRAIYRIGQSLGGGHGGAGRPLADSEMWAVVRTYAPHRENDRPARWLRVLGRKGNEDGISI
jgi:SAM-dependent methyltransferase